MLHFTPGSSLHAASSASKVFSYLQWAKSARAAAATQGKLPLFINMDETSIAYSYDTGKGLVVSKKALPSGKSHKKAPRNSSDHKTRVSFMAFVTHDSAIQPKLPQIFVGGEKALPLKVIKAVSPHVPEGFYLWREKSSWNNKVLMCRALRLLAKHLKEYLATYQVVLVLDVARSHRHQSIYSLAHRLGIILMYVPAKLTWLLQPADTHVFARLKSRLRQLWLDLCVRSEAGSLPHDEWLAGVCSVCVANFSADSSGAMLFSLMAYWTRPRLAHDFLMSYAATFPCPCQQ